MDTKKTILIVEDEPALMHALETKLEGAGYAIKQAADGAAAIAAIKEHQPDLVLLDILMPKVNGLEVLRTVKQDEALHDTEFIVFTNLSDIQELEQAPEFADVDHYIKSDTTMHDLIEIIEKKFA